jgi:PAS domain S-box-containing protein
MKDQVIICVDDESIVLKSLTRELHKALGDTYTIEVAESGPEALELLRHLLNEQTDIPVVIADYIMPTMKGTDLLRQIHKLSPTTRTILLSGYATVEGIAYAVNHAGLYRFVAKSWEHEGLVTTITEALQSYEQESTLAEQHKALQARAIELENKNQQLKQLKVAIDMMLLGVTIADLDGTIIYTNQAEAEMHGCTVSDLLGNDVRDLAPPELRHPRTLEEIKTWNGLSRESINLRKDGSRFSVWLKSEVVADTKGEPVAIVTSCEDITERKRVEGELHTHRTRLEELVRERTAELQREIEERKRTERVLTERSMELDTIFNSAPIIMLLVDKQVRVERTNCAGATFAGTDTGGRFGMLCGDLLRCINAMGEAGCGEEKACADCSIRNAIMQTFSTADPLMKLEGTFSSVANGEQRTYHLLISTAYLHFHDTDKVLVSIDDITEHKQAEEERRHLERQLRHAQKLEAVGTMAGGVAHDFNNILGTMMGYTEALLKEFSEESEEHTYLARVYRAGERAAELVRQILIFSRSQEHRLIPTRIAPIIEETLSMLRATLPATIDIHRAIQPDCRPILADATQIRQVIVNLCVNAAYAMRERGGMLTVNLKEEDSCSDISLKLTIRDTGRGIPPGVQEHIFEPFFTTKAPNEGSGLGLSVVHGVVTGHQGTITVESVPEQGTTFEIVFPVTDEPVSYHEQSKKMKIGITGEGHILLVDDDSDLTDLYEMALTQLGYQVTTCHNGEEALEAFQANPDGFDLVFTDQAMPGMTGIQLCQELSKIRADLPIVLTTGYSDVVSEQKIRELGIRSFLMKPVRLTNFLYTIQEILQ